MRQRRKQYVAGALVLLDRRSLDRRPCQPHAVDGDGGLAGYVFDPMV